MRAVPSEVKLTTRIIPANDPEWGAVELSLDEDGHPLSVQSRCSWSALMRCDARLVAVFAADKPVFAVAVLVSKTWAMPSHTIWSIPHLGLSVPHAAVVSALNGICEEANRDKRVLAV